MKTDTEKTSRLKAWEAFEEFLRGIYDEDYIQTAEPERIEFEWQEFKKDYSIN